MNNNLVRRFVQNQIGYYKRIVANKKLRMWPADSPNRLSFRMPMRRFSTL